jgi:hypothetical protein
MNETETSFRETLIAECRALQADRDNLLRACQAVLAWADRECMPQGGKNDGPWELVEAAIGSERMM